MAFNEQAGSDIDGVVKTTGNQTVAGVKTFTSDPIIPDEAYGPDWNGSLEPPTKNAVYDKMEALMVGGDFVGTTGDQSIDGVKTFTSDPIIPDEVYGVGWNGALEPPTKNAVYDEMETKADDSAVVHKTGGESIDGVKTFTSDPIIPDEVYGVGWNGSLEPPTKNAVYDIIETLAEDGAVVHDTGNETVGGIKTFTSIPLVPTEAYGPSWADNFGVPTKDAIYDKIEALETGSGFVHTTGNENIGGVKTFTDDPIIPDEAYSGSWNGALEPPTKNAVYDQMETKAADSSVVHKTGNESVGGVKTFTSDPIIPEEAYSGAWDGSLEPPTKNAVYDEMETKADDTAVVHLTGNESIDGTKTFTSDVIVPDDAYNEATWDGNFEVPTKNAIRDRLESLLAKLPLTTYKVLLTQTGTSAPTEAESHSNTLGGTPSLARPSGAGTYTVTLLNAFPIGKTHIQHSVSAKHASVEVTHTSASVLTITVKDASDTVGLSDLDGSIMLSVETFS